MKRKKEYGGEGCRDGVEEREQGERELDGRG